MINNMVLQNLKWVKDLFKVQDKSMDLNVTYVKNSLVCSQIPHYNHSLKKLPLVRSIYYIHGQEKLTSLKCPYHSKQSVDSKQFLSRYQQ